VTEAVSLPVGVVESGISIPSQLQNPNFGFIRLVKQGKEPVDKAWPLLARSTSWNDPVIQEWIRNGGNYGVVPLYGDVCILDCDDELLINAIVEAGVPTFSVTTGSGGKHYYFRCSGLGDKKIVIYDENDNHLGEVYPAGCKAYCVGPVCVHPNGNAYVPDDFDITTFVGFKTVISQFKSKFNQTQEAQLKPEHRESTSGSTDNISDFLRDNHGLKLADILPPQNAKWVNDELVGSHPIHGSENGHNWTVNKRTDKVYCRRCGAGTRDVIQGIALKLGQIECKDLGTGIRITRDDFEECLKYLRDLGYSDAIDEFYRLRKAAQETAKYTQLDEPLPEAKYHTLDIKLSPDNFISKYVNYWSKMTDAYGDYHIAGALSILSTIADRKLYFDNANSRLFTNLWCMLLGKSSIARKSTALSKISDMLDGSCYNRLSGSFSPEGLTEELSENSHAYMVKDECADLLKGMNSRSYMQGLRDPLCRLYDCRGEKRKLKAAKGKISEFVVNDPYLTFVWATTGETFRRSTNIDDVSSGWLLRFLFVYPQYPKTRMGVRRKEDTDDTGLNHLKEYFKEISQAVNNISQCELILSEKGYTIFNNWSERKEAELFDKGLHGDLFARYEQYALKLAGLFYLGEPEAIELLREHQHIVIIPDDCLEEAIRVIDEYFLPVGLDLIGDVSTSNICGIQSCIKTALKDAPNKTLTKSALLRKVPDVKGTDMNDHLDVLEEAGVIARWSKPKDGARKPTWYISLLD
jgi:hypothetical protein